ncbi:MAG: ATP-binding protein [Myxococcaceae bacterium]
MTAPPNTQEQLDARPRVLFVDDEENILRSLKRVLRRGEWDIETATSGEAGLELVHAWAPDVVISDYRMPGMNGVEFLARVKETSPRVQRIMLTGQADQAAIEDAINRCEVFRFVSKPWNDTQLVLTVRNAIDAHKLAAENDRLYKLSQLQNQELRTLNADLEDRVAKRTQLLSKAKREWELTFDTIHEPLAVVQTNDFVIRRANRSYAVTANKPVEELSSGHKCHKFLFDCDTACEGCPIVKGLQPNGENRAELKHEGKVYELSVYKMDEEPVAVCSYRDVTQERELTGRLLESEKMVAVGNLAGGVAHEINNPLGGILAFSQLMKRDKGRSDQDMESLDLIETSALRCKRIVESLLKFSRRSKDEDKKPFDLSKCVEDAGVLFKAQLKSYPKATFKMSMAPNLPQIHGDGGQIAQVVLNLMQNAVQALPKGEGAVEVETLAGDGVVLVRVKDNGCGIPEKNKTRIFEPHFTTKAPGSGTGLGLAIAYRLVNDHGGHFTVESEVDRGSTFTVSFPALNIGGAIK